MSIGKVLLLGTVWVGVLNLDEVEGLKRLEDYLSSKGLLTWRLSISSFPRLSRTTSTKATGVIPLDLCAQVPRAFGHERHRRCHCYA